MDQRRAKSGASQQPVNERWTRIAKLYGMDYYPWVTEPTLDQALRYSMGQDLDEGTRTGELARFLDNLEIGDDIRKDKQFRANVSVPFILPIRSAMLIWMRSVSAWTSRTPG